MRDKEEAMNSLPTPSGIAPVKVGPLLPLRANITETLFVP